MKGSQKSRPVFFVPDCFSAQNYFGIAALKYFTHQDLMLFEVFSHMIKFISSTEKFHRTEKCSIYNFKELYCFFKHFKKLLSS